jgi:putative hydrolase of the HAD superfamily
MSKTKFILFDCMETVIDIYKEPDIGLYSWWAYHGSGFENLWGNINEFTNDYIDAKSEIERIQRQYEECNILDRFSLMLKKKNIDNKRAKRIVNVLFNNFWRNYKANCFVDKSVKSTLSKLSSTYKCGIVSNFMIDGGIEELVQEHGVDKYFTFIVTSIKVGWRKPHNKIYDVALNLIKLPREQILFVGDNHLCDYEGPSRYGFNAVYLDKKNKNNDANKKIKNLQELIELLN